MIYIRVELWPFGDRTRARTLGEATVANVGGTDTRGTYDFKIMQADLKKVWKAARISNFPRKQLKAWDLLLAGLIATIGERLTDSTTGFASVDELSVSDLELRGLRKPVEGRPEYMEKLGVETDGDKTKTAGEGATCPSCGGKLNTSTNVPSCPKCGTKPFEENRTEKDD